jgi:DHA2 family multidrug resistance protein
MSVEAGVNKWVVAGTVMTGTMMAVLDSSIVNVALPDMAGTLGATIEEIAWVVTGYILSNVIIMPILGTLAEQIGRKRMYQIAVVLFTVASMLCGLARSLEVIVIFRVLQGLGGGVLMTVSQAILRESFPTEEQGRAMGVYGMGVVIAPALGPTLGGWLTDTYSWPWVFYINLPIGILNFVLVQRFIHDPPFLERKRGGMDWTGIALLAVGLGALQLMLEKGETKDWFDSRLIVVLAIVAAAGLAALAWHSLHASRPAVDLSLLDNRSFSAATAVGGILGLGLYSSLFILPLFLQTILGYTAYESGLALMPRSLAMAVGMPISGRLYNRLGPRLMVIAGLFISIFSFWELSRMTPVTGFWDIFRPQVWQGLGFSQLFVPLSTAALATIDKPRLTAATGLYNVVRQVAGSVGIAIAATEVSRGTSSYFANLTTHVTQYDEVSRHWMGTVTGAMQAAGASPTEASHQALALLYRSIEHQAAVLSYDRVMFFIAVLFAAAFPLALLLRRGEATGEAVVLPE